MTLKQKIFYYTVQFQIGVTQTMNLKYQNVEFVELSFGVNLDLSYQIQMHLLHQWKPTLQI